MIIGQVIRIDALAKRIVNCQIVHTAVALIKNKGAISFLTYTVSSEATEEEKARYALIKIGSTICAHGSSDRADALHAYATVRNIRILDILDLPGHSDIFKPTTEAYAGKYKIENNKTIGAILLLVKGIIEEKRSCLFCSDGHKQVYRVFLSTGNHIIKRGDIILIRDAVIRIEKYPSVYAQHISTVEVNPYIENRKVLAAYKRAPQEEIEVSTAEEIKRIEEDRSIFMKGRIFNISLDKSTLTIANHLGGITVKIDKNILSDLLTRIMQTKRYNRTKEVYSQLIFYKVLLTADIIWMKDSSTVENPSITLLV